MHISLITCSLVLVLFIGGSCLLLCNIIVVLRSAGNEIKWQEFDADDYRILYSVPWMMARSLLSLLQTICIEPLGHRLHRRDVKFQD